MPPGPMTRSKAFDHAEMLGRRAAKNFRRLQAKFRRREVDAFRIYDWDIPEVRAFVDWYDGQVVLSELAREQTDAIEGYGRILARGVAEALDVGEDAVWTRTRRTGSGVRYPPRPARGHIKIVREFGLRFRVNLSDYLDTGLFLDHRLTRRQFAQSARGKTVLNLFAYTGSFSVHAAAGKARSTTSVDLSRKYLDWTAENFRMNGLDTGELVTANVHDFVLRARRMGRAWDRVLLDPPSFSTRWGTGRFEITNHHRALLRDVLAITEPKGAVWFSTNHQDFEPDFEGLPVSSIEEITARTIPEDFRNPRVHRCFILIR